MRVNSGGAFSSRGCANTDSLKHILDSTLEFVLVVINESGDHVDENDN